MNYLILSTFLLCADWRQSYNMADQRNFRESNVILGERPSTKKVNLYFTGMVAANVAVGYALPKKHRNVFWASVAAIEASYVANNIALGVKFNF